VDLRWWPAADLPGDTDTIPTLVRLGRARLHPAAGAPAAGALPPEPSPQ
jgi:hypothetical protein